MTEDEPKEGDSTWQEDNNYIISPRKEYEEGKIELNFQYGFSDGSQLIASQNNDESRAEIRIVRDGEAIFDFAELLPEGYEFTTPNILIRNGESIPVGSIGGWGSKDGKVCVGDWQDPREILLLLHEIGHAPGWAKTLKGSLIMGLSFMDAGAKFRQLSKEEFHKYIRPICDSEKEAWKYAVSTLQDVQRKTGLSILDEIFPKREEMSQIAKAAIDSHKRAMRLRAIRSGLLPEGMSDEEIEECLSPFNLEKDDLNL
jgi:hypothetical protein